MMTNERILHLKPIKNENDYEDGSVKIINDFDKKGNYPLFTIKGFRDLLNLLIENGYEDYTFSVGYDSNCAYTSPTDIVKIEEEHIKFQE